VWEESLWWSWEHCVEEIQVAILKLQAHLRLLVLLRRRLLAAALMVSSAISLGVGELYGSYVPWGYIGRTTGHIGIGGVGIGGSGEQWRSAGQGSRLKKGVGI